MGVIERYEAILNYTTKIDADRTVGEIQAILAKAGAKSIMVDYENGHPITISFLIQVEAARVPFRLPSNWQGVQAVLVRQLKNNPQRRPWMVAEDHSRAVAWRIVKDWIEAQLAFIESGQASLAQLMLPHAVSQNGQTFFEVVASNPRFLLSSGK